MGDKATAFESIVHGFPEYEEVLYEVNDGVATVTINRPHNYNAYSTRALQELTHAFTRASWDDSVRVVVYTGAGHQAFCTGGDVKEYHELYLDKPRYYWNYMGLFKGYIESIVNCGKPTVARLNGMAVGGGNESQLACDLTVIGNHTFVAQVGTNVGSVACGGSTQWLTITVGEKRAREILMLNEHIQADKALDWGLVNFVAPTVTKDGEFVEAPTAEEKKKALKEKDGYAVSLEKLDEEVTRLCTKLKAKFPECTRYTKQQVNFWKDLSWHSTVGHARDWLALHYNSLEPYEGMNAFVEKRAPRYDWVVERAASGGSSEYLWGPYNRTCPSCDTSGIPSMFEFCGKCGAALTAQSEASTTA